MRNLSIAARKAARTVLVAALALASGGALAAAGQVLNLSGPLFAVAGDGSKRVLSVGSTIEQGDTLITEDRTYARVKFTDQGEVTLRPGSQLKVERYAFAEAQPNQDSVVLGLFKGALRTVTGLIGKRGNRDAYKMNTATATIGIRGTTYGAVVCPGPACPGELAPGTYVDVSDGAVEVGALPPTGCAPPGVVSALPPCVPLPPPVVLTAGQFGFVPPLGAPAVLPANPGLQGPTIPAGFEQGASSASGQTTPPPGCEVR